MDGRTADVSEVGNEVLNKLECAVCLQLCIQPVQLPCHHIFCYLCAKGLTHQNRKCAMCRQEIPLNYLDNPQLIAVQQSTVVFEGSYQWFYKGRNGWWQYDDQTSLEIDAAYKTEVPQCEVLIAGFLYIIDFQKDLQIRKCNPSCRRRIKRDLVTIPKKGVAGIRLNPDSEVLPGCNTSKESPSASDSCNVTVQEKIVDPENEQSSTLISNQRKRKRSEDDVTTMALDTLHKLNRTSLEEEDLCGEYTAKVLKSVDSLKQSLSAIGFEKIIFNLRHNLK